MPGVATGGQHYCRTPLITWGGCVRAGCRTGEAKLTKGFGLAARFIIHTVGPKFKTKYRTAAESSLYSCYRNIMQLVV